MKKTRLRSISKRPVRALEMEEDALWRKWVLASNRGRCLKCGRKATDAHHLITRGNKRLRHHLGNGVPLCRMCHGDAHNKPHLFNAWIAVHCPVMANIMSLANARVPIKYSQLLEQRIAELGNKGIPGEP